MADVLAVMDAAGSERAALMAYTTSGPLMATVAVRHPERVSALILYATMARAVSAPDYDWTYTTEEREARLAEPDLQLGQRGQPRQRRAQPCRRRAHARVARPPRAPVRKPWRHAQPQRQLRAGRRARPASHDRRADADPAPRRTTS